MKKKLISLLLVLVLVLCLVPTAMAEVSPTEAEAYAATRSLLCQRNYIWAGGASNSDDWDVFGLARDGVSIPQSYIISAKAFTPASDTSITDCARAILTLTACGETAGDALLAGVTNKDNMTLSNGVIYALLALDSKNYTAPADGISREKLIDRILSLQQSDNAWGYSYVSGTDWVTSYGTDVDTTAMAITALAPYYNTNVNVKTAVDKALEWLKTQQNLDGTFGYTGSPSVESTAQVIVALTALGIDPTTWNGKDAVAAMCSKADPSGGFRGAVYNAAYEITGYAYNEMSTYQGYYALVAYERFKAHQNALYNMACTKHTAGYTAAADSTFHWYACKNCGCIISMERHELTKTEAKAATCTAAGNIEYYYCSGCSCYYKDSAATEPVAYREVTVPALDHSYTKADCTTPATCRRCGVTNGTALGHNYINGRCEVCNAPNPAAVITPENAEKYVKVNEGKQGAFAAAVTGGTLVAQPAAEVVDPTADPVVGAEVETIKANAAFTARGAEVKMVLDLSVKLSDGTVELGTMPETAAPILFSVTLPSDVLCTIPANKDVALFYDHNGTVGFISADSFDRTTGKLTFRADKFSTYTVVTVNRQTHYDPPAHRDTQSPRTADSGILLYGALSVMSLLGMGHMGKKRS